MTWMQILHGLALVPRHMEMTGLGRNKPAQLRDHERGKEKFVSTER